MSLNVEAYYFIVSRRISIKVYEEYHLFICRQTSGKIIALL